MGSYSPPTHPLPKPWIQTPLLESPTLSRSANCRIFLKLENLQPSSSFKSRGIGNLILSSVVNAPPNAPLHFYSSSGGNAGLAAVTASTTLGYPCSVVVPTTTEDAIVAKLKAAGASEVLSHGDSWAFADGYLREVVMPEAAKRGEEGVYVPPFDDKRIWEGASTMVEEMKGQMPEGAQPDAIVCSVGGGGLFCGIVEGCEKVGWDERTRVLAMETEGAESLNRSLMEGGVVTLDGVSSVAKSLGAVKVADQAFMYAQRDNVRSVVLSDAEACMGCWRFADDERFLVEPACGVSVALCYQPKKLRQIVQGLGPESTVVIVVCGGSRISLEDMAMYKEKYGAEAERKRLGSENVDVASTHTA